MQWETVAYKLMLVASLEAEVRLQMQLRLQCKAACLVLVLACALAVNCQLSSEFGPKKTTIRTGIGFLK